MQILTHVKLVTRLPLYNTFMPFVCAHVRITYTKASRILTPRLKTMIQLPKQHTWGTAALLYSCYCSR